MICRVCGRETPEGSNYCQVCGARQTLTHCINCGHPVTPNAHYCPECGIVIYKPAQVQPAKKKKRSKLRSFFFGFLALVLFCLLVILLSAAV